MRTLPRLLRTVLPSSKTHPQAQDRLLGKTSLVYGGRALKTKHHTLQLPTTIEVQFRLRAQAHNPDVAFRYHDTSGGAYEVPFYDMAHIPPALQEIARKSLHQSVSLYYQSHKLFPDIPHMTFPHALDTPFFVKTFAYQAQPRLVREQLHYAGRILTKPSGRSEFMDGAMDLIPWGGFYAAGCALDRIGSVLVQPILHADGQLTLQPSDVDFWRDQGVNPFRGGRFHGYNLCVAGFEGEDGMTSLEDDIRHGKLTVTLQSRGHSLGAWRSSECRYVSRADELICVTFQA